MRRGSKDIHEETNLVTREFIDGETMDGLLLTLELVGKDVGKGEGD